MHAHDLIDLSPTTGTAMRSLPPKWDGAAKCAPAFAANLSTGVAPRDPIWFRMPSPSKQPEAAPSATKGNRVEGHFRPRAARGLVSTELTQPAPHLVVAVLFSTG